MKQPLVRCADDKIPRAEYATAVKRDVNPTADFKRRDEVKKNDGDPARPTTNQTNETLTTD